MYQSILFPIDIGSIDSYEENFTVAKALSNASTTKWHLIYVDAYSHSCSIPDDHIDPRRSAFFMARSILRDIRRGVRAC